MSTLTRVVLLSTLLLVLLPAMAGAVPQAGVPQGEFVEVVVTLDAPPLALATRSADLGAPYMRQLSSTQRALAAQLRDEIPGLTIRRRYSVVLDGFAVTVPESELDRLGDADGVARVYPSVSYRATRSSSPGFIGAPALWGPKLQTAGGGMKIGIIDDGLDRTHPYFNPKGYRMPRGFPKGQKRFTTTKVIVARAFAPSNATWRYARRPFDPLKSAHATHVAGIAAGNHRTKARGTRISGVAPKAYLGNYKVLTIPTPGFGLNGNSPEIVAAIEAAVRDGMDVINLSIGEAEIEPARDIVAAALDGAAAAGVVPVVAAGNSFNELGPGSVSSPGTSSRAITVAAETESGPEIATFSSGGPTPLSLRMKPDVTAPGVSVLSSVPRREGTWAFFSGTSMAAPHVAGAAALLRQRHRSWTVAQLKSALVQTSEPVFLNAPQVEADSTREGGGTVKLVRANSPLLFASPSGAAFGFVAPASSVARSVALTDAGGGAGAWTVDVTPQQPPAGSTLTTPAVVSVPGELVLTAVAEPGAAQAEHTGFVILSRGADRRRIPYWFRVAAPALGAAHATALTQTGTYNGDTRGHPALVDSYRYPEDPRELGVPRTLLGPEQVFRVSLSKPVANFGVAVTGGGSLIQPRVVRAGDENRLVGEVGLPYNLNPYLPGYGVPKLVVGAALPGAGAYDIVFDSPTASGAGPFKFRFWIGDTTPPSVRLLSARGGSLRISVRDTGSGIDPARIHVSVDGRGRSPRYDAGRGLLLPSIRGLRRGRHTLQVRVSDYQESKNMENVRRILPNTRRFSTTFVVR
ncbi:MAG: S8 family serine peptidase [Actinomycetota bacterium]